MNVFVSVVVRPVVAVAVAFVAIGGAKVDAASPAPNIVPLLGGLRLPAKPFPPGSGGITVTSDEKREPVRAGQAITTPCFRVVAPVAGIAHYAGCRLELATVSLGAGTQPDVPYFSAECVASASAGTADGAARALLQRFADHNTASPSLAGKPLDLGLPADLYSSNRGLFAGMSDARMFGREARVLNFRVSRSNTTFVDIVGELPSGRYVWTNPLGLILIEGYPSGYQATAFKAALARLEML